MDCDWENRRRERQIARDIVAGTIPPDDGARRIWLLYAEDGEPYPSQALYLKGIADRFAQNPGNEGAVMLAAHNLLNRSPTIGISVGISLGGDWRRTGPSGRPRGHRGR